MYPTFEEAAEFEVKVPYWDDAKTWVWERSCPKKTAGERLCQMLGLDPKKASRFVITIDKNFKVQVVAEYD